MLLAVNGSDLSERALRYALDAHPGRGVGVIHAVGGASPVMGAAAGIALSETGADEIREAAEPVFDRAREIAAESDVVVVGTHTESLADRLLVGDVAKAVFRRSPVPVTVVR